MTTWTFFNDAWHEGNPMIMGPMTHAPWLGSCVFDGARVFEGVAPDLDLHCRRLVNSARAFGLRLDRSAGEIEDLAREGMKKFPSDASLYVKPMAWAEDGWVDVDPDTTRFSVTVFESALPEPTGFSVSLSPFRRPSYEFAPTDAKAACHYPNSARALRESRARGFDNAVLLDALGHVSELATANIFYATGGEVHTPVPNGTFLDGITRQRVLALLRRAGIPVHERTLSWHEFLEADEVFSTGNYGKLMPITRIEARDLQPGPLYTKARELYWAYAHGERI